LAAAFLLRDKNPIVLEATSFFGGNSQGQEWNGIPYSTGAAYFVQPEEGSTIHRLLFELNLLSEIRTPSSHDEYAEGSVIKHGLWYGGKATYGAERVKITRVHQYLKKLLQDEGETRYPDIPTDDPDLRSYINKLDTESFKDHLENIAGGSIPYPLSTAIEQYCWSAFAASGSEISAASGLNFLTSELEDIAVLPGGNSRVTEKLCESLLTRLGDNALKSCEIVLNVTPTENGVEVLSTDRAGNVTLFRAPAAIVAAPKFVAKRIVKGGTTEQYDAMKKLTYRAYLTANVVMKGHPSFSFYDLYLLRKNSNGMAYSPTTSLQELAATDAILANWIVTHPTDSVVTLYRALPFDGGRATVLANESFEGVKNAFYKQITTELLPLFKMREDSIVDVRITRWGHALPVAATGFIASGAPELVRAPIHNKIFFAQQDNWALPAFEVALSEAFRAVDQVRGVLR
jgi:protoporphyrinogen oxidase